MIAQANAAHIPLPNASVHCVVTSPPYWGLRDYGLPPTVWPDGWRGCLGLEPTPDLFVQHIVQVFREVWRVLRPDGTCWVNLGDSYSNGGRDQSFRNATNTNWSGYADTKKPRGIIPRQDGLKPKDLCGIPWRVAFALQEDGWYLRSEIIWAKPNPMPESVTDRPTKAHEQVFLLAKQPHYFYDADAIREALLPASTERGQYKHSSFAKGQFKGSPTDTRNQNGKFTKKVSDLQNPAGRNRRTVWSVATQPYAGAHYATFPTALVQPMVMAGTSAKGVCPTCGAPWERATEKSTRFEGGSGKAGRTADEIGGKWGNDRYGKNILLGPVVDVRTTGWRPTCDHYQTAIDQMGYGWNTDGVTFPDGETMSRAEALELLQYHCTQYLPPVAATVLDPFCGSGTVGQVCRELPHPRRFIGLDLSHTYLRDQALVRSERKTPAQALDNLPLFGGKG